jgi:hypothetical protein
MHAMKTDATKHMLDAIAGYTGAVTHYPPGKARGPKAKPPDNEVTWWLQAQPDAGWPKEPLEAKRQRFKAQRQRIAANNEAVRKAHGLRKGDVGGR